MMNIHFIGIGGIGVSALARYYLEKGHKVFGSDLFSSEITDALKKSGAKIKIGEHKAENLQKNIDLVIFSPAVKSSNPELVEAKKRRVETKSYPGALGKLTKEHFTIAVSGTHGKSTTTALLSLILIKAGFDPTVIVGTKLKEFGDSSTGSPQDSNFRAGKSKYLIIEADEHKASFLNYWPQLIVLTNIDKDHLDYYKNLNNILKTFKKYIGHLPKNGVLIANGDDKNVEKVTSGKTQETRFFSLKQPEAEKLRKIIKIPGEYMTANALAALAAARALKISDKISFLALSEYNGAWRRFEILQQKPFVLISDYGHNPVKMLATLKGADEKYNPPSHKASARRRKIWCVYQPHQYQRTHYLFKEFLKAFRAAPADNMIITDIFDVAGREEKKIKNKVNSEKLAKAVKKSSVIYLPKNGIVGYLKDKVKKGDVLIIMGAGDIYKLCKEF